jgi:prevent-host-death family protein
MRTVSLVDAKAQLSRLVDQAANGSPFVISKHGRPVALVTALPEAPAKPERIGFMKDQFAGFQIPEDFDSVMAAEIVDLFEGNYQ